MKILYITPVFQHPQMRGPTRCYFFAREMSKRHDITMLTLARSVLDKTAVNHMTSFTERLFIFDAFVKTKPRTNRFTRPAFYALDQAKKARQFRHALAEMKKTFRDLVEKESFDVILFHGKSVYPVIKKWRDLPIVIDFCDATSMRLRQSIHYAKPLKKIALLWQYLSMKGLEKRLVKKTPHLAFISRRDREAIHFPTNGERIVPIGVDVAAWTRTAVQPGPNRIIFTGVMNYAPNEDAAMFLLKEILPRVKRILPDVHLFIVGREPSPRLQEAAKAHPHVTVTGFVADMKPYLEQATVLAAPLRYASGVQNKILEAMSMEVPVIGTSVVAAGLYQNGQQDLPMVIADDADDFAARLVALLQDKKEQQRLASAGRKFVERYFVWSSCATTLEEMCYSAVNGHRR